MKQFACGDVVPGCQASFSAESEDAILGQVAAHAREAHGMVDVPAALVAAVRANIHEA